jgi:hypothetical protein
MCDVLSDRVGDATKAIALISKAKWATAEQSNPTIYWLSAAEVHEMPRLLTACGDQIVKTVSASPMNFRETTRYPFRMKRVFPSRCRPINDPESPTPAAVETLSRCLRRTGYERLTTFQCSFSKVSSALRFETSSRLCCIAKASTKAVRGEVPAHQARSPGDRDRWLEPRLLDRSLLPRDDGLLAGVFRQRRADLHCAGFASVV